MSLKAEYEAVLQKVYSAVGDILLDDVSRHAKDIISRSVHDNVYNVYDAALPRRMDNGGLSDIENYEEFLVAPQSTNGDGIFTLLIMNRTPFQDGTGELQGRDLLSLAEVVEQGSDEFLMPFPRPFTERAEEEIEDNADYWLENGLRERGL